MTILLNPFDIDLSTICNIEDTKTVGIALWCLHIVFNAVCFMWNQSISHLYRNNLTKLFVTGDV